MREFKRVCKVFEKFLTALKRNGMRHELRFESDNGVSLAYWYTNSNIWHDGFVHYQVDGYDLYKLYTKALDALRDHEPKRFKNIKYQPVTPESYDGSKLKSLFLDEIALMPDRRHPITGRISLFK